MELASIVSLLLAFATLTSAYSTYSRQQAYSKKSSSSTAGLQECCTLSPWANDHMNEIRQLAKRLRQQYSALSRGSSFPSRMTSSPMWSADLIGLSGKTQSELDALTHQISEKLISEQRSGHLPYAQIVKPNFFEYQASEALENLYSETSNYGQQQQQLQTEEDFNQNYAAGNDMSKFDEVSHYSYPSEVKMVNGQTYVTHKNCTTATRRSGSVNGPSYSVLRVNRTQMTTNSGPVYIPSNSGSLTSSSLVQQQDSYSRRENAGYLNPVSASSNLHSIYGRDEVGAPNYSPQVTVDENFLSKFNSYRPPIVIPVETDNQHIEEVDSQDGGEGFHPSHTVTVHKYNRTIITGPDGKPIVSGSESKSVWDNGELVYDFQRPFGNTTLTQEEEWKEEERERLFWLFQQPTVSERDLQQWQRQQEQRLIGLAYRYNTTIDSIYNWQQHELDRYKALVGHYNTFTSDLTDWQQKERARIDWLIHQNSLTRDELNRWQRENQDKLNSLSRQYHISIEELKEWQRKELDRLYLLVNQQNVPMASNLYKWQTDESSRLHNLLAHHNSTVDQLQESIRRDQERLKQLSNQYHVNVGEMEKWLKTELSRLSGIITQQQEEMKRITDWQRSERNRLEQIVKHHNLTVEELEDQMKRDRAYMQSLAQKYHVSVEDLEKWQHTELERLHEQGRQDLEKELKEWQQHERDRLMSIIKQNDLTIEDFETKIQNDRARLQQLSIQYKVQVEEIEDWLKKEVQRMQAEGLLKQVEKDLTDWQQKERDRLLAIVQQNELTIEDLERKIKTDQAHLYGLSNKYQVRVEEIEDWLKKELQRLQNEGLVKVEDLKEWQKVEREKLLKIVQENKFTIEEFERRLVADKVRLQNLAQHYHIEMSDIESWLRKEAERLQSLGLIKAQAQLNDWQRIERDRLIALIQKNELSMEELEKKIQSDQVHLHSLAYQHHVRVEEIEDWLKQEVQRLQNQGLIQMGKLQDWQKNEREQLQQLVQQRDWSTEEFQKWLDNDRQRLQKLAMQHHIEIEEIEEWERNEGHRLESLGLIKPTAPLTDWQQHERHYLQQMTQEQQFSSTQELEQKLRQDREHLANLARQYHVQVEEIENWLHKELQRLRDQGQLQIDNLTAWQLVERDRLQALAVSNNDLTVLEFEEQLKKDREHLKQLAFEYHTSVEQVEEWISREVERLCDQGQIQIEKLTTWQMAERNRLRDMIRQQSDLSVEEFEAKLRADRTHLQQLSSQYHISIEEVEDWIRKEVKRLRDLGQLRIEELTSWQKIEREYITNLIRQRGQLSTAEFEEQLRRDHANLQKIAYDYHVSVEEMEQWMRKELQRLSNQTQLQAESLTVWQQQERDRMTALAQATHLTLEDFEKQLRQDRRRLQELANQYHTTVEEIENWLRLEAQRLANINIIQVDKTNEIWQQNERNYIQQLISQQPNHHQWSIEELERQLKNDQVHLQAISKQYRLTVEKIEDWYRRELDRLLQQGKIFTEQLSDWQRAEKDRLYLIIQRQGVGLNDLERQLFEDRELLRRLAAQYRITVEELENWQRNELGRLDSLGLGKNGDNDWEHEERLRLRTISAEIRITEEELLEFLANDQNYQRQLARNYSVPLETLSNFQRGELKIMNREGLFDQIKLNHLEEWQKRERDRLYALIKSQNFNSHKLREWQKQDSYLNTLAQQYHISVGTLRNWQLGEIERLEQLAKYYKLSLNQLEDFRNKELRTIQVAVHKKTMTDAERIAWASRESARLDSLGKKINLSGEALSEWRRRLYLLCQGLIDQDFGEQYGGEELTTSTGLSGNHNHVISQDRGDQPPQVYEEEFEETEPGLPGAYNPNEPGLATGDSSLRNPVYFSQSPPQYTNDPSRLSPGYLPPQPAAGAVYRQSGHVYRKKELTFTAPAGGQGQVQQYDQQYVQHNHRHGHGSNNFGRMESGSLTRGAQPQHLPEEDLGQQVQQEEDLAGSWTGYSGNLQSHGNLDLTDLGQQVQKEEDLPWTRREPHEKSSSGSYSSSTSLSSTFGSNVPVLTSSSGGYHSMGQQVELLDKQQIQPESYGQQVGSMSHTSYSSSSSSSSSSASSHAVNGNHDSMVIQAEPIEEQPGFWGKIRNKAKNIFSG